MDIEKDISIDKFKFEEEIIKQSVLIQEYHEYLAGLEKKRSEIKLELEVFEANLDKQIRQVAKEKGEKTTEGQISAEITTNKERIKLVQEKIDIEKECAVFSGVVASLEHKKRMIELLNQNYVSGFFSAPVLKETRKNIQRKRLKEDQDD